MSRLIYSFIFSCLIYGTSVGLHAAVAADPTIKPDDTVTLHLTVEDWAETQTAAVQVMITTAGNGISTAIRDDVLKILANLAPGDWKILEFSPTKDKAGLDRQEILAEARISDKQLFGIYDRAKKVSIPGKQVKISSIYFSPTIAEREALKVKLRAQLYRKVVEEISLLKIAFPDRVFRISNIVFDEEGRVFKGARRQAEEDGDEDMINGQGGFGETMTVSERQQLSATVILSAIAPK
ncbi:MAG: hypothetical protein R3E60_06200 [Alphaproteobacteria bacterium]